jgi:hypothetical protein
LPSSSPEPLLSLTWINSSGRVHQTARRLKLTGFLPCLRCGVPKDRGQGTGSCGRRCWCRWCVALPDELDQRSPQRVIKSIYRMQNSGIYRPSLGLNLTDQVTIVEYMPRFTGNYSTVFLGNLNNNLVRFHITNL